MLIENLAYKKKTILACRLFTSCNRFAGPLFFELARSIHKFRIHRIGVGYKGFINNDVIALYPTILKALKRTFNILFANRISERKTLHLTLQGIEGYVKNKPQKYSYLDLPNSLLPELEEKNQLIDLQWSDWIIGYNNPLGNTLLSNIEHSLGYGAIDTVGLTQAKW